MSVIYVVTVHPGTGSSLDIVLYIAARGTLDMHYLSATTTTTTIMVYKAGV